MTIKNNDSLQSFLRLCALEFQREKGAPIKDSAIGLNQVPTKSIFPAPSTYTFTVPSLSLFHPRNNLGLKFETKELPLSQEEKVCGETTDLAVQNLSAPKSYGKSDISKARADMALNMKKSLASLIRANFNSFFRMQARTYLPKEPKEMNVTLNKIASAFMGEPCDEINGDSKICPVSLCDVTVSFREIKDNCSEESDHTPKKDDSYSNGSQQTSDMQSFKFEASLSIEIYGCIEVATLSAPGKITGIFSSETCHDFENVQVSIDTRKLLLSMRNHARLIVLKAITSKIPIMMSNQRNHPMPPTVEEVLSPQKASDIHVYASLSLASLIAENRCSVSTSELPLKKRLKQKKRANDLKRMRLSSRLSSLKKSYYPNTPSSFILDSQIRALGK